MPIYFFGAVSTSPALSSYQYDDFFEVIAASDLRTTEPGTSSQDEL